MKVKHLIANVVIMKLLKQQMLLIIGRNLRNLKNLDKFKSYSLNLANLSLKQCKFHSSLKIKENFSFYSFYTRIWGDEVCDKFIRYISTILCTQFIFKMFRFMMKGMKNSLLLSGKGLLLSAACIQPLSDWKNHIISDEQLEG